MSKRKHLYVDFDDVLAEKLPELSPAERRSWLIRESGLSYNIVSTMLSSPERVSLSTMARLLTVLGCGIEKVVKWE